MIDARLTYESEVVHPFDADAERERRVAISRAQWDAIERKYGSLLDGERHAQRPVMCVESGRRYPNVRALARFLRVKRSAVRRAIRRGSSLIGFHFRWAQGGGDQSLGTEKRVRCVEQGRTYGSLTAAADANGIAPSSLSGAIKKGKPIGGLSFEYVKEQTDDDRSGYRFILRPRTPFQHPGLFDEPARRAA